MTKPVIPAGAAPAPPAPSSSLQRVDAFDGMRGLATILIVSYHVGITFYPTPVGTAPWWVATGSYVAVDMFLVLSGYLVTTLAVRELGGALQGAASFYRRRAVRLLPGLLVFLVAHAIYGLLADFGERAVARSTVASLLGVVNYAEPLGLVPLTDAIGHLWTLSIEVQFYLILPFLLAALPMRKPRTALLVLGAMILVIAVRRAVLYEPGLMVLKLLTRTDTHIDSALVGVALAYAWPRLRRLPTPWLSAAGWLGFVGWWAIALRFGTTDPFTHKVGFTLAAVFSAAVVAAALAETGPRPVFLFRPFVAIGNASYGLYLWHILIFQSVRRWGDHLDPLVQVGIALGATALVAVVSWNLVEKPAVARFSRRRTSSPP